MARKQSPQLTEAERRIMDELWARDEASVQELTDALNPEYKLAYTTVLTTIRIMVEKGYVDSQRGPGAYLSPALV